MFGRGFLAHRLLNDFFYAETDARTEGARYQEPRVDIYEEKESFVITAELPGMAKKDISVDLEGRLLTLKGERAADNETQIDGYYHRERTHGKFERTFSLPTDVETKNISADYKDGVLKILVPKSPERKPRQITVH
jgi:HSP20 family protein